MRWRRARLLATAAAAALAFFPAARAAPLTVFAAASLRESLDEVARAWRAQGGEELRLAYGASSVLARQIEAGAPAQVFLSADMEWPAYVARRGLVRGAVTPFLTNDLVLVAPASSTVSLRIGAGFDLAGALAGGRLALAEPKAVPAGRYARAALERLGVWEKVEPRLAPADNVRTALAMVARGEAPLGIVYRTDALAERRVRIVDAFPRESHPPIVYGMAELREAAPAAHAFTQYVLSAAARAIWSRHGFGAP